MINYHISVGTTLEPCRICRIYSFRIDIDLYDNFCVILPVPENVILLEYPNVSITVLAQS